MIWQICLLAPAWIYVCYTDWRYRIISNQVIAYVVILGLAGLMISKAPVVPTVTISMVALLCGYLMWRVNWVGAGDVKLFSALSLWHGGEVGILAIYMSVIGVFLALSYLLVGWIHMIGKQKTGKQKTDKTNPEGIPYGIAIVLSSFLLKTRLTMG